MLKQIKKMLENRKRFIPIENINLNVEMYKPQRNKIKVGLLFGFVGLCLVTPATNWLIGVVGIVLNKYPLWVFR